MTIEGNIGTVPRLLGWPKQRIRERVGELLELVGLDPEKDRKRYPGRALGRPAPARRPRARARREPAR